MNYAWYVAEINDIYLSKACFYYIFGKQNAEKNTPFV